jgi:hypothetical protein
MAVTARGKFRGAMLYRGGKEGLYSVAAARNDVQSFTETRRA